MWSGLIFDHVIHRSEVCTLLLCHGADPTLTNCHNKSALDLAASCDLQTKIDCKISWLAESFNLYVAHIDEFKGHTLLAASASGDIPKIKRIVTAKLITFKHPLTQNTSLVSAIQSVQTSSSPSLFTAHSYHLRLLQAESCGWTVD